jgi:hypothetical protein
MAAGAEVFDAVTFRYGITMTSAPAAIPLLSLPRLLVMPSLSDTASL